MPHYSLPALPYDYSSLEPWINGHIVELHHDKHHRAYVNGANSAIDKLHEARDRSDFTHVAALERELAFHVSGHVLHTLYWQNLAPDAGGAPERELLDDIERDFKSFELFKKQLVHCAATVMGSGWAALVYDPVLRRLGISQIQDHQSQITQGSVPLLVLDAWEHAYYLQYETDKGSYFENIFNLWNWRDVDARLRSARALDLTLAGGSDTSQEMREHEISVGP